MHKYDENHGYRFVSEIKLNQYSDFSEIQNVGATVPALVTQISKDRATANLQDGKMIEIPWNNIKWAKKFISRNAVGQQPKNLLESANSMTIHGR